MKYTVFVTVLHVREFCFQMDGKLTTLWVIRAIYGRKMISNAQTLNNERNLLIWFTLTGLFKTSFGILHIEQLRIGWL